MGIPYIVYLGAGGAQLYRRAAQRFEPVDRASGEPGALVAALSALPPGPVGVLVDVVDEEHVRDVVARIGRRDQRSLVARKLARAFPRSPFRSATLQGRNPRNPDEDRVLLSALTKPADVRVLLDALVAARVPVAGVFSPAPLAHRLLDADALAADAVLLATRQGDGSVRHSFFRQGVLAGSRLLRAGGSLGDDAQRIVRQFEESLRYFDPAYAADAARPLRVLLRPARAALLAASAALPEHWTVAPFDLAAACARAKVRAPVAEDRAETAWVELLGQRAGAGNLAPAVDCRYHGLFRVRSFAKVACLAVAGGALVGTLLNTFYIVDSGQRLAGDAATVHQLEAVLPVADDAVRVDPIDMQRAVAAYAALERHQVAPEAILGRLGAALGERPRIHVDAIEWSSDAPAAGEMAGEMTTGEPDDGVSSEAAIAPDGVVVTVRGHVQPFDGDYPLAFDEVEAFRAALAAQPGVAAARAVAQPLDVNPAATLTGEIAREAADLEAPFTLELVMRFADDPA